MPGNRSVAHHVVAAGVFLFMGSPVVAQSGGTAPDTTRSLGGIVVDGASELPPGMSRIPVASVLARDPSSVADIASLVPSAVAQTNSRGETLIYLRGSGERQLPLFFDGALVTVPWDRRVDVSLIPAEAIGAVDVSSGVESVRWGPSALGGALDLRPRRLDSNGSLLEASVSGGLPGRGRIGATRVSRAGGTAVTLSADAQKSNGDPTPAGAALPFSQGEGELRTNTDAARLGLLGRVERDLGPESAVALTLLHVSAEKGVAPESHLDPSAEAVRYWRYPNWSNTSVIANGSAAVGGGAVRSTFWLSRFAQTIDQYKDSSFLELDDRQKDRDDSAGLRLLAEAPAALGTVVLTGFGLMSQHQQVEGLDQGPSGGETFREAEASVGAEWRHTVEESVRLALGASADAFIPTETAGREPSSSFRALGAIANVAVEVGKRTTLQIGFARKTRFPSMRELYGEALGRFALNPDLRPESAWIGEVSVETGSPIRSIKLVGFGRLADGTIEQERLADGRRRRVNLSSSRTLGVEATGAARLGRIIRADGSVTLIYARARVGDERGILLTERPNAIGRLAISAAPPRGFVWAGEALMTGDAVSPGPDGLIDLPASVRINARVGYRLPLRGGAHTEVFLRADNVFDATSLPQAGLPLPGRSVRTGLRFLR